MKHIYDKDFDYKPAVKTNVKETFERVRKRLEQEAKEPKKVIGEIKPKVKGKV